MTTATQKPGTTDSAGDKLTIGESIELFTGYDEDKIETRFGKSPFGNDDDPGLRGVKLLRAAHFINLIHAGSTADDAYTAAMSLTATQLNDCFADEPDEPMPDEPVTPSGKDSSGSE